MLSSPPPPPPPPTHTHTQTTHTLCSDGCSSGQCIACCWLSKSTSTQINNRAKEAFSCRSTPSTPNTKVDDSAVRCPLSTVDTGVEQTRPVGATRVKAWNSIPRPLWQLTSPCALYSHSQSTANAADSRPIYINILLCSMACLSVKVMIRMNCDQVCC